MFFELFVEEGSIFFDECLFFGGVGDVFGFEWVVGVIVEFFGEDDAGVEFAEWFVFVVWVFDPSDVSVFFIAQSIAESARVAGVG